MKRRTKFLNPFYLFFLLVAFVGESGAQAFADMQDYMDGRRK